MKFGQKPLKNPVVMQFIGFCPIITQESILLTIPVAFIYIKLLFAIFFIHISYYLQIKVFYVILYLVLIGSFKHTASLRFSTSTKFISALSSHRHTSQCIFLFSLSTISHDFFIFPSV